MMHLRRTYAALVIGMGSFLSTHGAAVTLTQDAFSWQNEKHFTALVTAFSAHAEDELAGILTRTGEEIRGSQDYFKEAHEYLVAELQQIIYDWMQEDILSEVAYVNNQSDCYEESPSSSDGYASDEDPWRIAFMQGHEASSDDEFLQNGSDETFEEDDDERFEANYEAWKVETLHRVLDIYVSKSKDFTKESIELETIERFLKEHVEGGPSWLVNEAVCGSLNFHDGFAYELSTRTGIPYKILIGIFEGLWCSYDWEQFAIKDPLYIAKTFEETLRKLHSREIEMGLRERLVRSLADLFSFNEQDFQEPLSRTRENYNTYASQRNWLGAMIEWSIYCAYRKVFKTPMKSKEGFLKALKKVNKEAHVQQSMEAARARALENYKKVYLHKDTTKLVYKDVSGKRGELNCADRFKRLRSIGALYEKKRPRGKENLFVPELHIIVQEQKKASTPKFVRVPLISENLKLPARPLTRAAEDGVFKGGDAPYFARVKKDYVQGRRLQQVSEQKATTDIQKIIENQVSRKTDLIHSERVLMEVLRKPDYVQNIVETLASKLAQGTYNVRGIVLLGYSTNSVCAQCTPTLISLMNSHEQGGFMQLLVQKLQALTGSTRFTAPFISATKADWSSLRMNIFVTASKPFIHDKQACDLHTHPEKDPAVPQGHLYLPDNEFVLSEVPCTQNGNVDKPQRFFYEFVDVDEHLGEERVQPSAEVVLSSGSTAWKTRRGKQA